MTWTCALMTSVSATVNPSSTLLSSMNFFQPQSCSFLQKRCSVSAHMRGAGGTQESGTGVLRPKPMCADSPDASQLLLHWCAASAFKYLSTCSSWGPC